MKLFCTNAKSRKNKIKQIQLFFQHLFICVYLVGFMGSHRWGREECHYQWYFLDHHPEESGKLARSMVNNSVTENDLLSKIPFLQLNDL